MNVDFYTGLNIRLTERRNKGVKIPSLYLGMGRDDSIVPSDSQTEVEVFLRSGITHIYRYGHGDGLK
ncbi:hypothetical protein DSCW_45470 [Desulfosarcina widdelii]|uniref:Uncharacterized protein n=1 Tax=Desulfosarcina widdelii TaxID=947919 RepID=A0A5K7Z8N7_9BACT|nr:hypothetical protein DSCW_45470 [Desulfosarcina widdelii]